MIAGEIVLFGTTLGETLGKAIVAGFHSREALHAGVTELTLMHTVIDSGQPLVLVLNLFMLSNMIQRKEVLLPV